MWLFTRYGFFSVACARADGGKSGRLDPDLLLVRARRREHLERLQQRLPVLAGCEVKEDAGTDYRFRLIVPKAVWASALDELVREQTWSNFKNEAKRFLGSGESGYVHALHRVWGVILELQADRPSK